MLYSLIWSYCWQMYFLSPLLTHGDFNPTLIYLGKALASYLPAIFSSTVSSHPYLIWLGNHQVDPRLMWKNDFMSINNLCWVLFMPCSLLAQQQGKNLWVVLEDIYLHLCSKILMWGPDTATPPRSSLKATIVSHTMVFFRVLFGHFPGLYAGKPPFREQASLFSVCRFLWTSPNKSPFNWSFIED